MCVGKQANTADRDDKRQNTAHTHNTHVYVNKTNIN